MPAYNFNSRFVSAIKSGKRVQTIRPNRKRNPRKGETLTLYTGQRTKQCEKILTVVCVEVLPVELEAGFKMKLNGKSLNFLEQQKIADADGFVNLYAFYNWFIEHYGLPFSGVMIKWRRSE